jgi:hypothetical protein
MPTKRSIRVALSVVLGVGFASLLVFKAVILAQSNSRAIGFRWNLYSQEGAVVEDVMPGGPADLGGLRPGDVILNIDGARLVNSDDMAYNTYHNIARTFQRGRAVVFRVWRNGTRLNLHITPGLPDRWGLFLLEAFTALCSFTVMLLALPPALNRDLRARVLLGYVGLLTLRFVIPTPVTLGKRRPVRFGISSSR